MNHILEEYIDELDEILDCINVGIYITDGNGKTLTLNHESEKTGSLTKNQVIGVNMKELVEKGFVKESATLKALSSGKQESFIQDLGDGGRVFITGTPFYRNNKIEFVLCTERDITEMIMLEKMLEQTQQTAQRYEMELEYVRNRNLRLQGDVVARSEIMKRLIEKTVKVAKRNATVLLTGESGTGKEIFANLIYKNSDRVNKPFIKVNCAAIPEGLLESEFFGYEKGSFTGADKSGKNGFFEMANKGTLFLDEIGELPIHMQSKLLRAIQEKEVRKIGGESVIPIDVRIIAATNMDLLKAIGEGRFREDLYYRLNIIPMEIPPLRERKEDIESLAVYFTEAFAKQYKIQKVLTKKAVKALNEYDWPGNVRELKNIIERIVVSFDGIEITAFQVGNIMNINENMTSTFTIEENMTLKELMDNYEKEILEYMIDKYKTAATVCHKLQVNKSTMSRKIKKHKIPYKGTL